MRDNADSGHGLAAGLLRRARADARLTQARLAELAGTTQSAIAAYEAGAREPTVPVLSRMLAAAGARLEMVEMVAAGDVELDEVVAWIERRTALDAPTPEP
jgi:transcriptional regulator with XRE-family HTH domain